MSNFLTRDSDRGLNFILGVVGSVLSTGGP